jgi:hypothetical protein
LVCFRQHPDLSIHAGALVRAVLHLVQFLWRVSKLNLRLIATHPDRAAGIGFLGQSAYAFGPILFAQGTMLAGLIANRVLHGGENLMAFKMELAGLVALMILLVYSPLLSFNPSLSRVKREGLRAYGRLGSRYVEAFEEKWIRGAAPNDEELLGSCRYPVANRLGKQLCGRSGDASGAILFEGFDKTRCYYRGAAFTTNANCLLVGGISDPRD